jgi:hypothetical protein
LISGTTGLPVKNKKKIGIEFFLAVGCRSPFGNILQMLKNGMGANGGVIKKKATLS